MGDLPPTPASLLMGRRSDVDGERPLSLVPRQPRALQAPSNYIVLEAAPSSSHRDSAERQTTMLEMAAGGRTTPPAS